MANPLLLRTGIVAGLGTAAVLVFFASATGILPLRALANLADKQQDAAALLPPVAPVKAAATPVAAPGNPVEKVAMVTPAKTPTLTDNDVVARSFSALPAELQKPVLAAGPRAAATPLAAPAPLTPASDPSAPLSKRTVRVVAVKPDGTPDFSALPDDNGTVAQAYAEPHRPPVRRDIPALDAVERIGAGEQPAVMPAQLPVKIASTDPVTPKAEKTDVSKGTILGSGANVRSAPSKGNNKVLFALAGGASVKLGQSKNGWYRITDTKGRTGWVYKDYVKH